MTGEKVLKNPKHSSLFYFFRELMGMLMLFPEVLNTDLNTLIHWVKLNKHSYMKR